MFSRIQFCKVIPLLTTLLISVWFFVPMTSAERQPDLNHRWSSFKLERSRWLGQLADTVKLCVKREDTRHPVFHGCIDWHSSVHGHWALLRTSRVLDDAGLRQLVVDSLNAPGAMAREWSYLKKRPRFEMPYGRAWFLLLMAEYEQVTGSTQFRSFSDDIAASLKRYLLARTFNADVDEYKNQSWAYLQLLNYYRHTSAESSLLALLKNIKVAGRAEVSLAMDQAPVFFSKWANLAHLLGTMVMVEQGLSPELEPSARPLARPLTGWEFQNRPPANQLNPIAPLRSAHHLGINYSRAWGFWTLYSGTKDGRYLAAYLTHMQSALALHERYQNDYQRYGHWVPQFGIYALTQGMD